MGNGMETGFVGYKGIQVYKIVPTLGAKVCKYYLHWAIWIPEHTKGF